MPSRLPGDGCQGMLDATKAVIADLQKLSVYRTRNASVLLFWAKRGRHVAFMESCHAGAI